MGLLYFFVVLAGHGKNLDNIRDEASLFILK
jgi:hypothetical protein